MTASWKWPGSRWWKVDLHAHTPASHDFKDDRDSPDWERWVGELRNRGIGAVAVTDHNTAEGISAVRKAATADDDPFVFPGVELTIDGVHLLLIVDPNCGEDDVSDILSRAEVSVSTRGQDSAHADISIASLLKQIGSTAIVIAAHVNGPRGLLEQVGDGPLPPRGQQRLEVLNNRRLVAVEVDPTMEVDGKWLDGGTPEVRRRLTRVWGSDAHRYAELGRRFTWLKMTNPSLDGLRLALEDGSVDDGSGSVKPWTDQDPNRDHAADVLESISVVGAKHIGRPNRTTLRFNPWFNAIIGGRGTGKSTIVDFCRQTLRREDELPDPLRPSFNRRLRVPPSRTEEGLLAHDTQIDVVYRKNGERFRLSWTNDGRAHSVTRLVNGDELEAGGEISRRFPVRIYSQKQLFELAQDSNALLAVIDDSPDVRGSELGDQMEEAQARYLALRAQARAAFQQATVVPDLSVRLSDVQRKLDVLQEEGRADVLRAYRRRQRQSSDWEAVCASVAEAVNSVRHNVADLSVPDLDIDNTDHDTSDGKILQSMHVRLREVIGRAKDQLTQTLDEIDKAMSDVRSGSDAVRWDEGTAASRERFAQATKDLANRGVRGLEDYGDLLQESGKLQRDIERLIDAREKGDRLAKKADEVLQEYRTLREELASRRRKYVGKASHEWVKLEVHQLDVRDGLDEELVRRLDTVRFERDRMAIGGKIWPSEKKWQWNRLDDVVDMLRRAKDDKAADWPSHDKRFNKTIEEMKPEQVDRLALYVPEDAVAVQYKTSGSWRKLAQGSPGQQTAALLAFVLGQGTEPIILDQPEDDLDGTVIYDFLVRRLRQVKTERQVIVVTHNANIVVHGDAEYVMSLEAHDGQTHVSCAGGLQESKVRDEICRVMEGGKEAFRSRYRRILPQGTSDS